MISISILFCKMKCFGINWYNHDFFKCCLHDGDWTYTLLCGAIVFLWSWKRILFQYILSLAGLDDYCCIRVFYYKQTWSMPQYFSYMSWVQNEAISRNHTHASVMLTDSQKCGHHKTPLGKNHRVFLTFIVIENRLNWIIQIYL